MADSGEWVGWLEPSERWEFVQHVNGAEGIGNYPGKSEALGWCVEQITQLRDELREQWLANHWEHCQNEWPHEGICTWPLPVLLAVVRDG